MINSNLEVGSMGVGAGLYMYDVVVKSSRSLSHRLMRFLLSVSCTGLQQMVNVCAEYGRLWDIKFNSSNGYIITFGGGYSSSTRISRNNVDLKMVVKLKYLGCYFSERTCEVDFSFGINKFYGNFNNIMSVIGHGRNEMATLHLA